MDLERSIKISNKYGLHARASTRLAQLAKQFQSSISVSTPSAPDGVDAKNILGILTLGAEKGQTLLVKASGEDAEAAMAAIVRLVEQNFGEE